MQPVSDCERRSSVRCPKIAQNKRMRLAPVMLLIVAALPVARHAVGQQLERQPPPAGRGRGRRHIFRGMKSTTAACWGCHRHLTHTRTRPIAARSKSSSMWELARWKSAELDAELLYPRFEDAFGRPIDHSSSPSLTKLLNRTLRDISATTFAAKMHFRRPRPYQRLSLLRVCGDDRPPKAESHPTGGSSYPSGHSAYGWAVGMVLARVAPERSDALMIACGRSMRRAASSARCIFRRT